MNLDRRELVVYLTFLLGYLFIGHFSDRDHFSSIIIPVILLFAAYFFLLKWVRNGELKYTVGGILLISGLCRSLFLFAVPELSDDFYRFFWDGTMQNIGENPYLILPEKWFPNYSDPGENLEVLFNEMNSRSYYTVYPAVLQYLFAFTIWLSGSDWYGSVIILHAIYLVFELGTIYFLTRILEKLKMKPWRVMLYALNPLVIIELIGNLHPEVIMIFFLVLGVYFMMENKYLIAGIWIGLSISTKLIPFILLPAIWNFVGTVRFSKICCTAIPIYIILHLPIFDFQVLTNFFSSIDLYFRSFEFNGSIYVIVREIVQVITGYNQIKVIGPLMAVITFFVVVGISFRSEMESAADLFKTWLIITVIYYLMATTVHPWYLTLVVLFTTLNFRKYCGIIWSLLIFLSYYQYSGGEFKESIPVLILEYLGLIGWIIFEWWKGNELFAEND